MTADRFAFENLDIYKRAVEFALKVRKLCKLKQTDHDILDQLRRASLSIALNLTEGSGRYHHRDKKNFYYIARGSLFECIPILTILKAECVITEDQYEEIYSESQILAKMLTKLIQSVDKK